MIQSTDEKAAQKTVDVPITKELLENHALIGPRMMPVGGQFNVYDFYGENGNIVNIELHNNDGDEKYPADQYPYYATIPSVGRVYTMDTFVKLLNDTIKGMEVLRTTPVEAVEVELPKPQYESDDSDNSDEEDVTKAVSHRFAVRPRVTETYTVLYPVQ